MIEDVWDAEYPTYSVEDVERATGIPKRTLQRWHDLGHLRASALTATGRQRRYTPDDLRRAQIMAALRAHGFGVRRASSVVADMERRGVR